jgi:hypothetical protein
MKNFLLPMMLFLFPMSVLAQAPSGPTPLFERLTGTWEGTCQYLGGWYIPRVTFDRSGDWTHYRMTYQRIRHGGRLGCVDPKPATEEAGSGVFYSADEDVTKTFVHWRSSENEWNVEEFQFTAPDVFIWTRAGRFVWTPSGIQGPFGSNYSPGVMKKISDSL